MRTSKNVAIKVGLAVLVILYVIALTVSLMNSGPTVADVQKDLKETQQQLAKTQAELAAANKKLDEVLKQLQAERDRNDELEAQSSTGGDFGGAGASGSFSQPQTSRPTNPSTPSTDQPAGNGNTGGGSNGGGSTSADPETGLVDGLTCSLGILCL